MGPCPLLNPRFDSRMEGATARGNGLAESCATIGSFGCLILHMSKLLPSLLGLLLAGSAQAVETPASKPNIIFVLADDLGIGNVSCYGADHFKTPNLDALAQSGIRFDHCFAAPLCGPSRALLMTGRYAFHTGMTSNQTGDLLKPENEVMMPKVLKTAGYVSGMCGKWAQLPLQPGDWGFDEYLRFEGSGQYWNTQPRAKSYTLNGKQVPLLDGEYLPDKMHDFVADFISRHKEEPFYLYYSMSHIHGQILPTPDTAPGTKDQNKIYNDNVAYMDKLVGKLVAELDRLKLREKTLIVFAGDNGTASPWYELATVHGKALSGHKATMLECGSLVPCIASWPGTIKAGQQEEALVNSCDFFPTFAALTGAKLPAGVTIDGRDFAPQLCGQSPGWPRSWIYVQLGRDWFDREADWKLDQDGGLFDMRGAPFVEKPVPADQQDETAMAAHKRLQGILDDLNPAGGILDPKTGSGKKLKKKGKGHKNQEKANPGNTNAPGE